MRNKIALFVFSLALLPQRVLADTIPSLKSPTVTQADGDLNSTVQELWNTLISTLAMEVIAALAVILVLAAGIQYITAGGNAEKTKKARQSLINIILGIILLVSIYTLIGLITGVIRYAADQVGGTSSSSSNSSSSSSSSTSDETGDAFDDATATAEAVITIDSPKTDDDPDQPSSSLFGTWVEQPTVSPELQKIIDNSPTKNKKYQASGQGKPTYVCIQFSRDMEAYLENQTLDGKPIHAFYVGIDAFISHNMLKNANPSDLLAHAVVAIENENGSLTFIEPQNGKVFQLTDSLSRVITYDHLISRNNWKYASANPTSQEFKQGWMNDEHRAKVGSNTPYVLISLYEDYATLLKDSFFVKINKANL